MRANVLLPTATLPATPITYGTRGAIVPRNVDETRARSCDALDVEVEQSGQREVDRGDLVEVDALVDPAQLVQVGFAQRHRRRRPERRPVVAPDRDEPGRGLLHPADPRLGPWSRCNPRPTRHGSSVARSRRHPNWWSWWSPTRCPTLRPGQRVTVLDPACGDGRFLTAAAARIAAAGAVPIVTGVDIDADAVRAARRTVAAGPGAPVRPVPAGRRAPPRLGRRALRRRARQPAVPLPTRGQHDEGRVEPPRRRAVRRRRGRVPRPRRAPGAARRRAGGAGAAAVDPRLPRRGRSAVRRRPPRRADLVVVVAAAGLRRPGVRVRARLRGRRRRGERASAPTVEPGRRRRPRRPGAAAARDGRHARAPAAGSAPTSATSTTGWSPPSTTTRPAHRS